MFDLFRKNPMLIALVAAGFLLLYFILNPGPAAKMRATEEKSLKAGRTICLACRQYARENAGAYPPSLDTLFPKYLQDRSKLTSPLNPAEPVGYTYTPPPPNLTDSPDTVVIEDKFAPSIGHNRLVIYANGSAVVLPGQ